MKIIHTSDWHLGISLHNSTLIEEQRSFVDYLISFVKEENIDGIIIAGDIFDNSVSSSEAISVYNYAVTSLCNELGIPVIISAGNHDGAARLASCNELLIKAGLYVYGKLTIEIKPVLIGDVCIFTIPYFNIDEVRALYPTEKVSSYSEAMEIVVNKIKSSFIPNKKNILICHCFVGGSELSESDRSALVGGTSIVSQEVFEGFDYVAMGHLHKAQNRGYNIRYSGSPLKYSFSEALHKKTITLITIEDEFKIDEIEVSFLRNLRVIKGTYDEIKVIAENDNHRDDYIKIELTDVYAGMEAVENFRTYYKNLLSISGKTNELDENQLTVEELNSLSSDDLLERFYMDVTGTEISDEQKSWFNEAMSAVQDVEVNQ